MRSRQVWALRAGSREGLAGRSWQPYRKPKAQAVLPSTGCLFAACCHPIVMDEAHQRIGQAFTDARIGAAAVRSGCCVLAISFHHSGATILTSRRTPQSAQTETLGIYRPDEQFHSKMRGRTCAIPSDSSFALFSEAVSARRSWHRWGRSISAVLEFQTGSLSSSLSGAVSLCKGICASHR